MSPLNGRSIHQVVATAAPGDAITNSVLEIRSLLREFGSSEVFACNVHDDLQGDVHPVGDYDSHEPGEARPLTLVHVSMGDDRFLPFVCRLPGELIVSYHNLTPPAYFAPWDAPTAQRLEAGRRYLPLLRDRTVAALADSTFNATDLRAAGYTRVRVGGLILGTEHLAGRAPADIGPAPAGPVVLSVGQLYPHKRPDLLVAAFHQFLRHHGPDGHLVLAGSDRLPAYATALRRYVDRLGLGGRVTVTGHIPDAALVAWYRRADLFVTVSEHEGFCVPLAEAMQFDVPIVARDNGAVAETLGGAGLLLPGDTGPSRLAAALAAVVDDEPAKRELVARGRVRRRAFSAEAGRRRFLEALAEMLGGH